MKQKRIDIENYIKNSYDVDVPDCWDKIENADISNVPHFTEKKKVRIIPFYRIIAVTTCLVIIIAAWFATPEILNISKKALSETSYERIGSESKLFASVNMPENFDTLISESPYIMEIRIDKWLGEDDNVFSKTYFECTIINLIKGNINKEKIILIQNGNSKGTFYEYPLFKIGDQFLAFFSLCTINESVQIKNCYRINAMYHSIFDSIRIGENKYLIKRTIPLTKSITTPKLPDDITQVVRNKLINNDFILSQNLIESMYNDVYQYEDLLNEIISKEGE